MANINDLMPSRYIKTADLKGQPKVLHMSHVTVEDVGDADKPILHFSDAKKGMVLNVTNKEIITEAYGPEYDVQWPGKPLELYPDRTPFKGVMTDCLRVRVPQQPAPAPVQQPVATSGDMPAEPAGYADVPLAGSDEPPF